MKTASSNKNPADLAAALVRLDRQMDAAGLVAEHPWRAALAGIINEAGGTTRESDAPAPGAAEPAQFFKLNASYQIAGDSTLEALMYDFGCLQDSGISAVSADADSLSGVQWAGVYLLQQAHQVFREVERRVWHQLPATVREGGAT